MHDQRICRTARGTGSARSLWPSEARKLFEELASLRDVLTEVADRLSKVEVPCDERSWSEMLRVLETPALSTTVTPYNSKSAHVLPLRQWRLACGWTQAALMARMRSVAATQGSHIPKAASLKTMVSRWENGHPVSEFYRDLLARVFDQASPRVASSVQVASGSASPSLRAVA